MLTHQSAASVDASSDLTSEYKLLLAPTVQPWQNQLDQLRLSCSFEQVKQWGIKVLTKVKAFLRGWGGGVRGICLETSALQQINTTTHVRDVWSCTVCKIPHLFTYIHPRQQLYAMLAWIASMTGNAILTLQQSGWAGDRTQERWMLMETMHLWQKHPSSDMLIRTQAKCMKTRWNSIRPAHHHIREEGGKYKDKVKAYTHTHIQNGEECKNVRQAVSSAWPASL